MRYRRLLENRRQRSTYDGLTSTGELPLIADPVLREPDYPDMRETLLAMAGFSR